MIEFQNIMKQYEDKKVLDDISFSIEKGNVVGLLGRNGAGKSTIMNIVTGYIQPTSGNVIINGKIVSESNGAVRNHFGYLPEQPPLYDTMTVYEYLYFVGKLKGIDRKVLKESVLEVMEQTMITDVRNQLIRFLSKGYRQRVGIAHAMLGKPDILILDEPTIGLDPAQMVEIRDVLQEYGKEHIVLISSHILSEINTICDKVLILNNSKIVADCNMDELNVLSNDNKLSVRVNVGKEIFEECMGSISKNIKYSYKGVVEEGCSDWEIQWNQKEDDLRKELFKLAIAKDFMILHMIPSNHAIEEIFLELTSG